MDLLDAYRHPPALSLRRIGVLVQCLPLEAATVRAMNPETAWSTSDYLLADVVDAVRTGTWVAIEKVKRKGARNPAPKPVPRPTDTPKQAPRRLDGHQLAAWLKTEVG